MADCPAPRRENKPFRLGAAPDSTGTRYSDLDEWYCSGAQWSERAGRSSGWNDVFHGFGDAAVSRGRCADADRGRHCWSKAHRSASVANVLWAVHRGRVIFYGTVKPPAKIAFISWAGAASTVGVFQHKRVFNSYGHSADF